MWKLLELGIIITMSKIQRCIKEIKFMLYIVRWNDLNCYHEVIVEISRTAWMIYWMCKKQYENYKYDPIYLTIMTSSGVFCDPLEGETLPFTKFQESPKVLLNPNYNQTSKGNKI